MSDLPVLRIRATKPAVYTELKLGDVDCLAG